MERNFSLLGKISTDLSKTYYAFHKKSTPASWCNKAVIVILFVSVKEGESVSVLPKVTLLHGKVGFWFKWSELLHRVALRIIQMCFLCAAFY